MTIEPNRQRCTELLHWVVVQLFLSNYISYGEIISNWHWNMLSRYLLLLKSQGCMPKGAVNSNMLSYVYVAAQLIFHLETLWLSQIKWSYSWSHLHNLFPTVFPAMRLALFIAPFIVFRTVRYLASPGAMLMPLASSAKHQTTPFLLLQAMITDPCFAWYFNAAGFSSKQEQGIRLEKNCTRDRVRNPSEWYPCFHMIFTGFKNS